MTLEETIAKCDERVKILIESMNACDLDDPVEKLLARNDAKGADEQRQLAEWLKELQERRKSDNEIPFGNAPFSDLDSIINAYEIHGNHKKVVELLKELRERRKRPEVVYCKDCKHKGTKNCVANAWTTIFGYGVKDDFYCGLAERASNE